MIINQVQCGVDEDVEVLAGDVDLLAASPETVRPVRTAASVKNMEPDVHIVVLVIVVDVILVIIDQLRSPRVAFSMVCKFIVCVIMNSKRRIMIANSVIL